MSAWYNEIDPKKAAWLRELISRGHVAPGIVDERSITDVRPEDLEGFEQCHFFAGIGIWSYALRLAGWPDDREVWTGSCPCQPFSAAGKAKAFDDSRHLWPEFFRLIKARGPLVCFGEQVASIDGLAWLDLVQTDLDAAGYTVGAVDMCAAGVGAPHIRQRLYWVADSPEFGRDGRGTGEASGRPSESERLCNAGGLANDSSRRRGKLGDASWPGDSGHNDSGSITGRLADFSGTGLSERKRSSTDTGGTSSGPEQDGQTGGVGDAKGRKWGFPMGAESDQMSESSGTGQTGGLDDSNDSERGTETAPRPGNEESELSRERCPVNGFWSGSDWVLTRPQRMGDSPGLRPVESGSFPLVDGAPQRVGRLRGYGDAIVAQVAAAFIEAWLDESGSRNDVATLDQNGGLSKNG